MNSERTLLLAALIGAAVCPCVASAAPTIVSSGAFSSGAHATKGTATIYKLDDGTRIVRLTDFGTSNGPEVHVYLSPATAVKSNEDVTSGGFVDLGDLKGNTGNQNYPLPSGVALDRYHTVSIWCARFHVNFGSAILK
jgi:hypothetical protein